MLDRLLVKLAKTEEEITSSIEKLSYDFDKIEIKIGNYEASRLLDDLKSCEDKTKELHEKYKDYVRELDRINEDLREINYEHDNLKEKIPDDFDSLF